VLIKAANANQCFTRLDGRVDIVLRPCNPDDDLQKFFAIRGAFDDFRFEISQKTAVRYCLNQAHHPKWGEVLEMQPCTRARHPEHMTSWWEKW
jgi:hypothetical protein